MDMEIAARIVEKVAVLEVSGFIDGKTAPVFQDRVLQTMDEVDTVLMDLSLVDFMSSAGLRAMLITYRQSQQTGNVVALAGMSDEIRDNMEATGFIDFFTIFDTVAAALEKLN